LANQTVSTNSEIADSATPVASLGSAQNESVGRNIGITRVVRSDQGRGWTT
jgi:hypothetical protein